MRPTEPPYAFGSGGSWSLTLGRRMNQKIMNRDDCSTAGIFVKHTSNKRGVVLLSVFVVSMLLGMVTHYIAYARDLNRDLVRGEMAFKKIRAKTDAGLLPKHELIDMIKGYISLYASCSSSGELDVYKDRLNKYE